MFRRSSHRPSGATAGDAQCETYRFVRENGSWKVDQVAMGTQEEALLRKTGDPKGLTGDELVQDMLSDFFPRERITAAYAEYR
jgi:hypothetical protein